MRSLFIISISGLLACNDQAKQVDQRQLIDTALQADQRKIPVSETCYTTKDSILIWAETGDTLRFTKTEFNSIVDKHPEFCYPTPDNPDRAYYHGNDTGEYGSEVGQDTYYQLYAYFMSQKNGLDKYAPQRKKLIDIYVHINTLFGHFQYGGTYFGHQSRRIPGYAAYSIYLLSQQQGGTEKSYDIAKQRELYIKSLRQLIDDESSIDANSAGNAKVARTKELNKLVDELNVLLTDLFYLRRAQEFQYGYYAYY